MPAGKPTRLLTLAETEFRQISEARSALPVARKFKPILMNAAKLAPGWERKRAAAVRLTAVLLREDDIALERRVCSTAQTVKTYTSAADWLQRESAYLRKIARLLDTAGGRLTTVLGRCQDRAPG
jgi:hypothetical protein